MEQALYWLGGYIWLTAFVLGAVHALQPGHGKTIVAAYLVGARGTVRDALMLGVVVTGTHTLIIYVLAAAAHGGSLFLPMEKVEGYLGAFASLLILGVGVSLLYQHWRSRPGRGPGHGHGHEHDRGRPDGPAHAHRPGAAHAHADPAQTTSLSRIFVLGISGGIVPCPEGLAVFLAAIAGGRIDQGLLLVAVFSLGLAATLVAVGIAFLKASALFRRFEGGRAWGRRVGWASAVLITLVGAAYLGRYLLVLGGAWTA